MKVQIELIGYLRTQGLPNGQKTGELQIGDGVTLAELLSRLKVSRKAPMLVAVNDRVLDPSYVLQEGDVVQFAPPLAGG